MVKVAEKVAVEKKAEEKTLVRSFRSARRVSTPIIAIETPDPAETMRSLKTVLDEPVKGSVPEVLSWDIVTGVRARNKVAESLNINAQATINLAEALSVVEGRLSTGGAIYIMNAHRHLEDPAVVQAIWNIRDVFKLNRRTLILLGPIFKFPAELQGDVIVLSEPLPTRDELKTTLLQQFKNAEVELPDEKGIAASLDAVVGLPPFAAEQVIAMSLRKSGIDQSALWERKCKAIEQTDGLRVYRGGETFADLRGVDNVIAFMQKLVEADAFGVVVFIDEGEKVMAGGMADHVGDTGVSKDQIAALLSYIQDTGSMGVMLGGIAGTGKSAIAKATGNAAGKPTIALDLGGMKVGTVGSSEAAIRNALKVITATAEGRVLFVMTANNTASFSPEINRRFPDQFFFDNPGRDGRDALFALYGAKNKLTPAQLARDTSFGQGWTGAEIKRSCERAAMFKTTVVEAATFIVPQCVSGAPAIARLRDQAKGKFLSANYPGVYSGPVDEVGDNVVGRSIDLEE